MTSSAKQPKRKVTDPVLIVAEMPTGREISFEIIFDGDQKTKAIEQLALLDLQKLRFGGKLTPRGKSDWVLSAELGASATQACVVTLDPVKTRIDSPVSRVFTSKWEEPDPDSVSEMDGDVESEPVSEIIDLAAIAVEALALALPLYPRTSDAGLDAAVFSEPGIKPMTDEDTKPFAGLAALKEKLEKDE